jgi:tripartite-type tricarboxylate transporter receptor subunit TctC
MRKFALASLAACFFTAGMPVTAAVSADYYAGKQITMVVGYSAGGGFDFFARLVARHYGRYIPGQPTIVVQNKPGASSVKAANYLYNAARKDGSEIGALGSTLALNKLLGRPGKYDASKFFWIGRIAAGDSVGITWHSAGVKSIADAKKKQIIWAAGSPMGPTMMTAVALNKLNGTKFKIVKGYKGSSRMLAAMERGEAEGTVIGWAALNKRKQHLLRDNKVDIFYFMGYERNPELPNVPTLIETAPTEEGKKIFKLLTSREVVGRNFSAPPGIPAAAGAALRLGFERMVKDKAFLDDINKRNIAISPLSGEKLQKVVEDVMATDAALAKRLKWATSAN